EQDGEALANEEKEITDEEKKEVLDEAISEEDFGEEQE
ncbi:30S ribosomal protein S2, partial [Campylobacter jejuni]|nr:30S ribosomal protein S2 [Campylobacter jejuni]